MMLVTRRTTCGERRKIGSKRKQLRFIQSLEAESSPAILGSGMEELSQLRKGAGEAARRHLIVKITRHRRIEIFSFSRLFRAPAKLVTRERD